ncbi:MAG: Esterase [Actinomycetia bacterium]|nr:Esterase [Actinomycetes bacterium]
MSFIRCVIGRAPRRALIGAAAGLLWCGLAAVAMAPAVAAPVATTGVVFVSAPGTSAPPATLGSASSMLYSMLPLGPDSRAAGTSVSSVAGPAESLSPSGSAQTGTIGFSAALNHCLIGGCWATWSNGYKGDVYVSGARSVTITLPAAANAFYLYAEPNQFENYTMTATTSDGTTSGPISVAGDAGAKYFGFYTTGTAPLASITVTGSDPTGFAIGEFGISAPYQFILPDSSIHNPRILAGQHHRPGNAIDIPVPAGTPYYAITSGTVTRTAPWGACGKGVILKGDDGVQYTYCGGSRWLVRNGTRVAAGTELGLAGNARQRRWSQLQFQIAYPATRPKTLRCPQSLLVALYDNAVNGKPGTVPNPQDLPSTACACRQ